jgi:hypothetical protein
LYSVLGVHSLCVSHIVRPLHVLLRHPSALLTLVFLRLNFDVSLASDWSVKTTSFSIEFKLIPSTYHILPKRAKLRSLASATGYKYWPLPLLPTFLLHPHTSTSTTPSTNNHLHIPPSNHLSNHQQWLVPSKPPER